MELIIGLIVLGLIVGGYVWARKHKEKVDEIKDEVKEFTDKL